MGSATTYSLDFLLPLNVFGYLERENYLGKKLEKQQCLSKGILPKYILIVFCFNLMPNITSGHQLNQNHGPDPVHNRI